MLQYDQYGPLWVPKPSETGAPASAAPQPQVVEVPQGEKKEPVMSPPPPVDGQVVDEKVEYRDENGNILNEEQVKALEGKVSFKTRYETRTRLVDQQGNDVNKESSGAGGGVAPPHPDVQGQNPETIEKPPADGARQPFVLADGDRTGFSLHGDFVAGWDEQVLQRIIDGCDAGDSGMDRCPDPGPLNTGDACPFPPAFPDPQEEWLEALPGNNPVSGWDS